MRGCLLQASSLVPGVNCMLQILVVWVGSRQVLLPPTEEETKKPERIKADSRSHS